MTPEQRLDKALSVILEQYGKSFSSKAFSDESTEEDDLMLIFGLIQAIKTENKQYWGRELGMCWQRLIVELCNQTNNDFGSPIREGLDEICDLTVGHDAIDTKYRIGSGDSGTLKKFKHYGARLTESKYRPVLLILRNDNLPAAITACITGGWTVYTGEESFKYVQQVTGFDLKSWLQSRKGYYSHTRAS
ncbi:MAG: restriction endonuclease [Bacteroidia bacterium]|nr:restriction endonuclease [Bacteroidia bacterium]